MLETRKEDKKGAFRKPTSIKHVTSTRYLENILEVQVCRSSMINK